MFWALKKTLQSAPNNMTGRRFHRTTEAIPRRPWKSKSPFAFRPMQISIKRWTRGVCARYDAVLPPLISVVCRSSSQVISVPDSGLETWRGIYLRDFWPITMKPISRVFQNRSVQSLQTLVSLGYEGPSAISAFSLYWVRIADFGIRPA